MRTHALVFAALLASCGGEDVVQYERLNADGDDLTIAVGTAETSPAESIELHSTTGEVTIGTATVDPSGGPIGTEHEFVVVIDDQWAEMVDRVSVRLDSGERGEDEYDMDRDSVSPGIFVVTLVSVGDPGETRDDVASIHVWDIVGDSDQPGSGSDDSGG